MIITTDPQRPAILHADGRVWVPTIRGWLDSSLLKPQGGAVCLYIPVSGRQYRGSITLSDAVHPRSLTVRQPACCHVLDSREERKAYYNPEAIILAFDDGATTLASLSLDRDYDSWLDSHES